MTFMHHLTIAKLRLF